MKSFKQSATSLSKGDYASIIFGSIVGLVILDISNNLAKFVHQDNWIAAAVGAIYPLYMVSVSIYLGKKCKGKNILDLSKKFFGKVIGGSLNFIFMVYFMILLILSLSDYSNMIKSFIVNFLSITEIVGVVVLLSGYVVYKGVNVVGRLCKITFFLTIILVMSPIPALRTGRFINIFPILQSGSMALIKGAISSSLAYSGVEIVFIIYPMLKDKKSYVKVSILPILIICFIYMWACFIGVYYLGSDVVVKSKWSFLLVTESVTVKVINNYKYVFIFIWSLIIFKSISVFYYASTEILKHILSKINIIIIILFIYFVSCFISVKYGEGLSKTYFIDVAMKFYVIFNTIYVTVISGIVFYREKKVNC